ncbi:MAG: competence protein ComEC family protein, partial [Lachnospiraceae bacterium]|nr:competence protein ComEC family protein [Lachnospiraceae bacterium]
MRIGACIGFSALTALIFAVCFGSTFAIDAAVVCFVLFVCTLITEKVPYRMKIPSDKREGIQTGLRAFTLCLFSAFAALLSFWAVQNFYTEPIIENFADKTLEFSGQVVSSPVSENGTTSFTVKTNEIDGEKVTLKITVYTNLVKPLDCYDNVTVCGDVYSNYAVGFGYQSYCGARGIFLNAYVNQYYDGWYTVQHCQKKPWYSVFSFARECAARCLEKYLSFDLAKVCSSIITGEKTALPDEIYNRFKVLGTAHMLVVSGLHLSIAAGVLAVFAEKLIKNKRMSALIQIVGVLSFAALTGFGFSVTRSCVMVIIMILARSTGSKSDGLNSLGVSSAVLCLNPLGVGDIGLLWSISSTLSIILFSGKISNYLNGKLKLRHKFTKGIVS